ncbi:hypothetical protein ACQE3E_23025 [Methylomonas sp. MED-D]|uniref:hypothetical protein n=1 Tax=unclassified Methylomonas TaxID=2608980 RepID=UPI0028A41E32|nr:hypothetical protein [Methylomonas sp. MV1]MDT4332764.1 hypothetical protein [Methylomonas sp. MV1]
MNNEHPCVSKFISLCFSIDELLGAGSIVDRGPRPANPPKILQSVDDAIANLSQLSQEATKSTISHQLKRDMGLAISALVTVLQSSDNFNQNSYVNNLEDIYQVKIEEIDQGKILARFKELHDFLHTAYPARSLKSAFEQWREDNIVSADEYLNRLSAFVQLGTQLASTEILPSFLDKHDINSIIGSLKGKYKIVDTKDNWQAYCIYEDEFKYTIEINGKYPLYQDQCALFAFHEVFPGHVAEAAIREYLYRKNEISSFYTLQLLNTPRNLLSEGLADYSLEYFKTSLTVSDYMGFVYDKVFTDVRHNLAIKILSGTMTKEEASEELVRNTWCSKEKAETALLFAIKWKLYFPTYATGYYFVHNVVTRLQPNCWSGLYLSNDPASFIIR